MMLHCLFLLLSTIVGEWHGVFVSDLGGTALRLAAWKHSY
uniref:Uncharacterized protein n=1 Tax=Anguilla anguilla TaxID=7936 RepID=A0A0E9V3V4_ANGAN